MVSGPNFIDLFLLNAGEKAINHLVFRFWISIYIYLLFNCTQGTEKKEKKRQ